MKCVSHVKENFIRRSMSRAMICEAVNYTLTIIILFCATFQIRTTHDRTQLFYFFHVSNNFSRTDHSQGLIAQEKLTLK
ncbi:CLUMA_CG002739, isoform A [Clunio marinus]|uniref:CLUMA_CG002739, isoform A n=1 Tax=Clunio marinus TaxID=568069 RepID=A0A1J1HNE1_9DIPT|nr:CLUMA_CG002739, isoform A [Clunio marinus]